MISKTFAYHKSSEKSMNLVREIRKAYSHLEGILINELNSSRELSIALTRLEESGMWAVKSIVSNDPNSVREE